MDNVDLLNQFTEFKTCEYNGRKYIVRDNGAVYRIRRDDGRLSPLDEKWTFGRFDKSTGYMFISEERVHRIVCTAFHGVPVGDMNIVDHIDINKSNNRQENLRWVTPFENLLLNPITRAKIETICGSVENFLKSPALLFGHEAEDKNFSWMRTVTKNEAELTLKRWLEWASKPIDQRRSRGSGPGEWIYKETQTVSKNRESNNRRFSWPQPEWSLPIKDSLTHGAKQIDWRPVTEFFLCPGEGQERTLQSYLNNLVEGKPFSQSRFKYGDAVFKCGYNPSDDAIIVITENRRILKSGIGKPWEVWRIYIEDGYFVHQHIRRYSDSNGAERDFTQAMGKRWTGSEVFDDYFG